MNFINAINNNMSLYTQNVHCILLFHGKISINTCIKWQCPLIPINAKLRQGKKRLFDGYKTIVFFCSITSDK